MEQLAGRSREPQASFRFGREAETAAPTPSAEPAADPARWRTWLAGTPREVLARIVHEDPLGVRPRVAERMRAQALLLDADRVLLRTLARCARFAGRYHGRPELAEWIDGQVDDALEDLLREDASASTAAGTRSGAEPAATFVALARPLGLEPEAMRDACGAFNRLPLPERRAFFDLVLQSGSLDDLARAGEGSATEIARRARRALDAVLEAGTGRARRDGREGT